MNLIPPRLILLHLDSRRTRGVMVLLAVIAIALRASQPVTKDTGLFPQLTLMLITLAAASVMAGATRSPFGDPERAASSPMSILRLTHLLTMIAAATAFVAVSGWTATYGISLVTILRNLAGFTGIALITAAVLGPHLSWTVPMGYVMYCGGQLDIQASSPWSWPLLPAGDLTATAITIALLITGIAAVSIAGARDRHDSP
jgi:hypothetical protein